MKDKDIPLCPFPKGREAGIRCPSVEKIWVGHRFIYVCNESECAYFEHI